MNTLTIIGAMVLIALQVADVWTTQRGINNGTAKEANQLAAKFFAWLPQNMWWMPKVLLVGIPILGCLYVGWPLGTIGLWALSGVYSYIVWNNYKIGSGK